MTDTETEADATANQTTQPGWDALLEDLFGLNIRSLQTIREMFVRPANVFAAARSDDWGGKFTPSIRLVFSLFTVMLLLSFFWAGENSLIFRAIEDALKETVRQKPDIDLVSVTNKLLKNYFLFLPFTFALFHSLGAMLLFIWGKGTRIVQRLRFYYLAMIPSSAISILSATLLGVNAIAQTTWIQSFMLTIPFLLNWVTSWRCLETVQIGFGRLWRGLLFALVSLTMTAVSSIASFMVAGFLAR